jgi:hypothetical protein
LGKLDALNAEVALASRDLLETDLVISQSQRSSLHPITLGEQISLLAFITAPSVSPCAPKSIPILYPRASPKAGPEKSKNLAPSNLPYKLSNRGRSIYNSVIVQRNSAIPKAWTMRKPGIQEVP